MPTINITIPDLLVTLYADARATRNPYIAGQGGTELPPATASALTAHIKGFMKAVIISEAIRTGKTSEEIDALRAQLNGL